MLSSHFLKSPVRLSCIFPIKKLSQMAFLLLSRTVHFAIAEVKNIFPIVTCGFWISLRGGRGFFCNQITKMAKFRGKIEMEELAMFIYVIGGIIKLSHCFDDVALEPITAFGHSSQLQALGPTSGRPSFNDCLC